MDRSRVAVIRCTTYDEDQVYPAIRRGLDLLGGIGSFVSKGEKIVIKPNVVAGDAPERCVGPHPEVFRSVARLALEQKVALSYGDSPAFTRNIFTEMNKAGFTQVAEDLRIPLADFENGREVFFPESPFTKRFFLAKGALEADGIINLCKLKTHLITRLTGAVKNLFGCIPGSLKPELHVRMPSPHDFSRMLVALNLLLKPRLHIMDGVMAMQGNGPRSGDPVAMNVLLFSSDPVALDAVACRLVDLDLEHVPTMKPGREWGLGTYLSEEIELLGDSLDPLINGDFEVVRKPPLDLSGALINRAKGWVAPRPIIREELCTRCGACVAVCPTAPKAVNWRDQGESRHTSPPVHDYSRCIRCFCCQEVCPERAIIVRTPFLGRIIFGTR